MIFRKKITQEQINVWMEKKKYKRLIRCLSYDDKSIYKPSFDFLDRNKDEVVSMLSKFVNDKNQNLRHRVIKLLIASKKPEIESILLKLIKDQDSYIKALVINGLGNLQSQRAVQPLIKKLESEADAQFAARALGKIKSAESIPALIKKVNAGVTNAAWALGELRSLEADAVLIAAMFQSNFNMNAIAVQSLEKIGWKPTCSAEGARFYMINKDFENFEKCGEIAFKAIGNYSKHPDPKIRQGLARFLGNSRNPEKAREHILNLINPTDFSYVQIEVIKAIGKLEITEAHDFVMTVVKNAMLKELQFAALECLGNLKQEKSIPAISKFLEIDILPDVNKAVKALVSIGGNQVIQILEKELSSDNPLKLELIIDALEDLQWIPGDKEKSAVYYIYRKQYQKSVDLGDLAVPALKNSIYSNHQHQIIWALGEIDTDLSIKTLIDFYKSEAEKNIIIKRKILTALSQSSNPQSLEIYKNIINNSGLRDIAINGLLKIGKEAIPLMVECLILGYSKEKIYRNCVPFKNDLIKYMKQLMDKSDEKELLSRIINFIDSKEE